MRRFFFFLTVAAVFALNGCKKDENHGTTDDRHILRFTAGFAQTKSFLDDNRKINFHSGDKFSLFSYDLGGSDPQWKNQNVELINGSEEGQTAVLTGVGNEAQFHIAVYPYCDKMCMDVQEGFLYVYNVDKLFQVPETQVLTLSPLSIIGKINTFANGANISVSFAEESSLSFRSACPIAKVTVQRDDIAKITISADEQICGEVHIWVDYVPSSPTFRQFSPYTCDKSEANTVSVFPDENYGDTFVKGDICYVVFLPSTDGYSLTNFSLTAYNSQGDTIMSKTKTEPAEFLPNTVYYLGTIRDTTESWWYENSSGLYNNGEKWKKFGFSGSPVDVVIDGTGVTVTGLLNNPLNVLKGTYNSEAGTITFQKGQNIRYGGYEDWEMGAVDENQEMTDLVGTVETSPSMKITLDGLNIWYEGAAYMKDTRISLNYEGK